MWAEPTKSPSCRGQEKQNLRAGERSGVAEPREGQHGRDEPKVAAAARMVARTMIRANG